MLRLEQNRQAFHDKNTIGTTGLTVNEANVAYDSSSSRPPARHPRGGL